MKKESIMKFAEAGIQGLDTVTGGCGKSGKSHKQSHGSHKQSHGSYKQSHGSHKHSH